MKKSTKKALAILLSVSMILGGQISNFKLSYATDIIEDIIESTSKEDDTSYDEELTEEIVNEEITNSFDVMVEESLISSNIEEEEECEEELEEDFEEEPEEDIEENDISNDVVIEESNDEIDNENVEDIEIEINEENELIENEIIDEIESTEKEDDEENIESEIVDETESVETEIVEEIESTKTEIVEEINETTETQDESEIVNEEEIINETEFSNEVENIEETTLQETNEIIETTIEETVSQENIATLSEIENIEEVDEEIVIATQSEIEEIENINEELFIEATPSEIEEEKIATISELKINMDDLSLLISPNAKIPPQMYTTGNYGFIEPDYINPKVERRNNGLLRDNPPPTTYDNRTKTGSGGLSVLPPVRDQAPYGTCWMFSTMGMIEASARKQGIVATEEESNLSEAAAGYFYFNLKNVFNNPDNLDKPAVGGADYNRTLVDWRDQGGEQQRALLFLSNQVALTKEDANTKYEVMGEISPNAPGQIDDQYAFKKGTVEIDNVYYINREDRDLIKKLVMEKGSVGISYCHPPFGMGAVQEVDGEWYLNNPSGASANHAVNIVGWDDNIPKGKFRNDPATDGGWLIRNSWGEDGVNTTGGYFWLSYCDPSIGYNMTAVDAREVDKYKYNYHYDGTANQTTVKVGYYDSFDTSHINQRNYAVGNVYKVTGEENQTLDAVEVFLNSANAHFKIKIYTKDTSMSYPMDGNLQFEQEVTKDMAGIYTIPLNEKVPLTLDTYYSIVLEAYTDETFSIFADYTCTELEGYGMDGWYNYIGANQSFIMPLANYPTEWDATYTGTDPYVANNSRYCNYRIRGLANPGVGLFYDANTGSGTMPSQPVAAGSSVTISANAFTKTGYKFTSWNTKKNGTGTSYTAGQTMTVNDYVILYAQWTPISYTLKLNPTEVATATEQSFTYTYEEEVNLSDPGFNSPYKDVDYWTANSDGTGTQYTVGQEGVKGLTTTDNDTVILYAKWKPATYTIKFHKESGNSGEMNDFVVEMNQTVNLPANQFSKTGYLFEKWSHVESGTGDEYLDQASIINLTNKNEVYDLYIRWKPVVYTIKFSTSGGSTVPDMEKTYGVPISLPTNVTKYGYKLDHWCSDIGCTQPYDGSTDRIVNQGGQVTCYAAWTPVTYKISFNMTGVTAAAINMITKTFGEDITLPTPDPATVQSGYAFVGWYKEQQLLHQYTGNTDLIGTENDIVTIYAKWKKQVAFNNNGHGITPQPIDTTASEQSLETITLPNISCAGYQFEGWYKDQGCTTGNFVGYGGNTCTVTGATTLYAKWRANEYTLKFAINGPAAPTAPANMTKVVGTTLTLPNPTNIPEGFIFDGWYKEEVCTNQYDGTTDLTTNDGASFFLYAKWKVIIKYHANGHGDDLPNQEAIYGKISNYMTMPHVDGYNFVSWYKNAECTQYAGNAGGTFQAYGPMDFYALWNKNTYTVKYNAKGGTVSPIQGTKTYTETLSLPTPTKVGYEFGGWYKEDACTNSYDGTTDLTGENGVTVEIFAKWTGINYTIQFNATGHGTAPSDITKTYGTNVTLPEPTNQESGYLFMGWFKEDDCINQYNGTTDLTTTQGESFTLYAKWKMCVIFNANGHGTAPAPVEVSTGTHISLPNITCNGYKFLGWYEEQACTNLIGLAGSDYTISVAITMYAKWEAITYTISYNVGNIGAVAPSNITKTYGTPVTLTNPTSIPTGYTFEGWYKEANYQNVYTGNEDLSIVENDTKVIYARWKATVTFNANGHGTAPDTMNVFLNTNITLPNITGVEGYTFGGWYKEVECNNKVGNAGNSFNVSIVTTLYAKWTENTYTVGYDLRGATWIDGYIAPTQRLYTEDITIPDATKLNRGIGFEFGGWYDNVSFTGSPITTLQNVASNKTLYAKWSASAGYVLIKFNTNGGNYIPDVAIEIDTVCPTPTNPTRNNYTFAGWFSDTALTIVFDFTQTISEETILYAKWNAIPKRSSSRGSSQGVTSTNYKNNLNETSTKFNVQAPESTTKVSPRRTQDIPVLNENVSWIQKEDGTWSLNIDKTDSNKKAVNGYYSIKMKDTNGNEITRVYNFDENGDMVVGWVKDDLNNFYFFENEKTENEGMMVQGWKLVNDAFYFFSADGKLLLNTTAPDGRRVGVDGKCIDLPK